MSLNKAYRAVVTRQTDEHVWFNFVGETGVELAAPRGSKDMEVGTPTVVKQLDNGKWFIADAASWSAGGGPLAVEVSVDARNIATFTWKVSARTNNTSLELQSLELDRSWRAVGVITPRATTYMQGRYVSSPLSILRSVYRVRLRLTDGTLGPWTEFSPIGVPTPRVSVTSSTTIRVNWEPPDTADTYRLQIIHTIAQGVFRTVVDRRVSSADGTAGVNITLSTFGRHTAFLYTSTGIRSQGARFNTRDTRPRPSAPSVSVSGRVATVTWLASDNATNLSVENTDTGTLSLQNFDVTGATRQQVTLPRDGAYVAVLSNSDGLSGPGTRFTVGDVVEVVPKPPSLAATISGRTITFTWNPPSDATTYNLQLTTAGGSTFTTAQTVIASSAEADVTVTADGEYMARLEDRGQFGDVLTFTVGKTTVPETPIQPPTMPDPDPDPDPEPDPDPDPTPEPETPVPPTLTASVNNLTVTLTWTAPSEAASYTLQITDVGTSTFKDFASNIASATATYTATLTTAGAYKARLVDGTTEGASTSFTLTEPPTPTPPSLRAQVVDNNVLLSWTAPTVATTYTLQVSGAGNTQFADEAAGIRSGRQSYVITRTAGTYQARLVDRGVNGSAVSFTVAEETTPTPVEPTIPTPPSMSATVRGRTVTFRWAAPSRAATYTLEMTGADNTTFAVEQTGVRSSATRATVQLAAGGKYQARLVEGTSEGRAVSFQSAYTPPALQLDVGGYEALTNGWRVVFEWATPSTAATTYDIQLTGADSNTFSTVFDDVRSGSDGQIETLTSPGGYQARLVDRGVAGPTSSFDLPANISATTSGSQVNYVWTSPGTDAEYSLQVTSAYGTTFATTAAGIPSGDGRLSGAIVTPGVYQARLSADGVAGKPTVFSILPSFGDITWSTDNSGATASNPARVFFRWSQPDTDTRTLQLQRFVVGSWQNVRTFDAPLRSGSNQRGQRILLDVTTERNSPSMVNTSTSFRLVDGSNEGFFSNLNMTIPAIAAPAASSLDYSQGSAVDVVFAEPTRLLSPLVSWTTLSTGGSLGYVLQARQLSPSRGSWSDVSPASYTRASQLALGTWDFRYRVTPATRIGHLAVLTGDSAFSPSTNVIVAAPPAVPPLPTVTRSLSGINVVYNMSWTPPAVATTYRVHLFRLEPGPGVLYGDWEVASGDGRFFLGRASGGPPGAQWAVRLIDRGVDGPLTAFRTDSKDLLRT